MAAVTLYTRKNELAGGAVVEDNRVKSYSTTVTNDTLSLPLLADQGFSFVVLNTGTQSVAFTAQTGETVTGAVAVAGRQPDGRALPPLPAAAGQGPEAYDQG